MARAPYNPGLSDKAWKDLHRLLARLHVKYAAQMAAKKQQPPKDAA